MSTPSGSSAPDPSGSFVPPSAEELGALLPQYEISHLIATGGMGAVYAGTQRALDRPVAIKILPPDTARDGESIGRFRTEAKAMARLIHPNIPAVYDFDVSGGYCYLVMEFIDGFNVHQLITQGKLTPDLACNLLSQVCSALSFAHQRGIVHGDIKPSNLLVTQEGTLKLADFGLAHLAGARETANYTPMGTPEYTAPELWQRGAVMDHRADLYSLGCVFYEMLTGSPPQGSFKLPAAALKLDPKVDIVIDRCMQQKPELRYQSAEEVKKVIDAIQPAAPAATTTTTTAATAPAKVRKVRAPVKYPGGTKIPEQRAIPLPAGPPRRRSRNTGSSPAPWIWLLVVGVAVLAVFFALKSSSSKTTPPPPVTETPPAPIEKTAATPEAKQATPPPAPPRPPRVKPAPATPPAAAVVPPPTPPPTLTPETEAKLAAFRAKYRNEWQIEVAEKLSIERYRLGNLYSTALDKFREDAGKSGDAAALLAVRNEADRFNSTGAGVPDSQLSPIEKLATLQKTLTASLVQAEAKMKPVIAQLRESCLLELQQIENDATASADKDALGALYDRIVAAPDPAPLFAD